MAAVTPKTNEQPTDYVNPIPNAEVRLAYYVYTWDETNMPRQRTAWSSIGTYYLSGTGSNTEVIYGSNQNQLIKSAGSAGVNIVDNTLGLIANVQGTTYTDVSPIIIYTDGKYLAGLDNNTVRQHFDLHTKLNTIDLHYIETHTDFSKHEIKYTNLYNVTTSATKGVNGDTYPKGDEWVSATTSDKGTIQENTFVALIGESGGINRVTNTGFVYNGLTYKRPYDSNITWRNFTNYVGGWTYGSNGFNVAYDTSDVMSITFRSNNGTITAVTDMDVLKIGDYIQEFKAIKDSNASASSKIAYSNEYNLIVGYLTSTEKEIDILLGNKANAAGTKYPVVSQAAISKDIFTSISSALALYATVSNMNDVWTSATSAITVDRIPWNSTFIDINANKTATGFVVANNRTNTWQYTKFPTIDETWDKVTEWMKDSATNTYDWKPFLNQYPITANASTATYINKVWYNGSTGLQSITSDKAIVKNDDGATSLSYYISAPSNYNLINSANKYRFLGMTTEQENYSNDQGSNVISITGFNKILLEDLYENPNNYQIPNVTWYYTSGGKSQSTANALDIPVNEGISYAMSITSALNTDNNFLVAGVGAAGDNKGQRVGYNGVFYIPLPSSIETDEDGKYEDTHWMLTTYTPQVNVHASTEGIYNSGSTLYKYTKMNNLITTGVFGGFTSYHTADTITANLVNIPQVSYSSADYKIGDKVVVTSNQNAAAKIGKLISNIAYIIPANGVNNVAGDWRTAFENQITSNSDKCTIITLNSYEAAIIDKYKPAGDDEKTGYLQNSPIGNAMYLDLFGYKDEEWNNLSFDVNRKYIFTFNCHIQATNLNLASDQINYGTPSLLLLGHFRQRYAKTTLDIENFGHQAYAGETMLIPLLNKPLENAVNNIYNIEGTYTLSWDTTGTNAEKALPQKYSFYIPDEYNDKNIPFDKDLGAIYTSVYGHNSSMKTIQGTAGVSPAVTIGIPNITETGGVVTYPNDVKDGNRVKWMNVMDRIYAFILVGQNVNPNVSYQFVNNNAYQSNNRQILSTDDIKLFAGMNNVITTTAEEQDKKIFNSNPASWLGIDSGILGVCEPMFSMTIQRY